MDLPHAHDVAPIVHEAWRRRKLNRGIESRLSTVTGKELLVCWDELCPEDQEDNCEGVRDVYLAVDMLSSDLNLAP